jgi:hypothetical protein
MATPPASNTFGFPTDLVAAITDEAALDADRVGQFLQSCGLRVSPDRPIRLPSSFLMDLGAALRLLDWEQAGIRVHLDAGLPTAEQLLCDILESVTGVRSSPSTLPLGTLTCRVVALFAERFSWHGRKELAADVIVDEADEEDILETLADFLWKNRPR